MSENSGSSTQSAAPTTPEAPIEPTQDVNQVPVESKEQTPPPSTKKKFKYNSDNQDFEEELDDTEITRRLSLAKAAHKRMSEAAMTKKQAENFINMLQTNPRAILENPQLGLNFRKLAEDYLAEQLQNEMMSPEQKAQKEMEKRLRAYEEQEKTAKQRIESEQQAKLEAHYAQSYEKTITEALQTGGIPKTASTVKRMAELMSKSLEHGLDLEPKQLVEMVREDYIRNLKEITGSADAETLLKLLGDDLTNKIRKYDLQKLKSNPNPVVSPRKQNNSQTKDAPDTKLSPSDWSEMLRKQIK